MEWMLLPLKRYADFGGRSRRLEYWMFQLGQWLLAFVIFLVIALAAGSQPGEQEALAGAMIWLVGLVWLLLVIPNLAVTVRRLHDQDKSGWWFLISFIPFGGLVLLVLMFIDGTPGENRYGPSPKGGVTAQTFD